MNHHLTTSPIRVQTNINKTQHNIVNTTTEQHPTGPESKGTQHEQSMLTDNSTFGLANAAYITN